MKKLMLWAVAVAAIFGIAARAQDITGDWQGPAGLITFLQANPNCVRADLFVHNGCHKPGTGGTSKNPSNRCIMSSLR